MISVLYILKNYLKEINNNYIGLLLPVISIYTILITFIINIFESRKLNFWNIDKTSMKKNSLLVNISTIVFLIVYILLLTVSLVIFNHSTDGKIVHEFMFLLACIPMMIYIYNNIKKMEVVLKWIENNTLIYFFIASVIITISLIVASTIKIPILIRISYCIGVCVIILLILGIYSNSFSVNKLISNIPTYRLASYYIFSIIIFSSMYVIFCKCTGTENIYIRIVFTIYFCIPLIMLMSDEKYRTNFKVIKNKNRIIVYENNNEYITYEYRYIKDYMYMKNHRRYNFTNLKIYKDTQMILDKKGIEIIYIDFNDINRYVKNVEVDLHGSVVRYKLIKEEHSLLNKRIYETKIMKKCKCLDNEIEIIKDKFVNIDSFWLVDKYDKNKLLQ